MGAAEQLAPERSNVVPFRWTARSFVRAGVVFTIRGATVTVSGPPGRADLHQALVVEVGRRVETFATFDPGDRRRPFPRVSLPGVVLRRSGACDACDDALEPGRGGMCPLCTIALQKTLRAAGRIG